MRMKLWRAALAATVLVFGFSVSTAQSPVGGGLVFHFNAQNLNNTGVNPGAGGISSWADTSGNGRNLNNGAGANYVVNSAAINNQNFVSFSGGQYLRTDLALSIAANDFATGGNTTSSFYVLDFNGGIVFSQWSQGNDQTNRFGWEGSNRWDFANDGAGQLGGWSSTLNGSFQLLTGLSAPGANNRQVFLNGTNVRTGTTASAIIGSSRYALGGTVDGNANANVDFAEVIHYNRKLNAAEQQIVENNLSSKYNLTIANDRYSGDTLANGHRDFGVVGVGSVDASNISSESTMVDGLKLRATGSLDGGDFVLAGHGSGANTLVSAVNSNISAGERWSREWYVDATGTPVNLELAFDFGGDGFPTTDGSDTYSLLYKANDGADFSILGSVGAISGNSVLFNVGSASIGGGIITLGINAQSLAIPEPASIALWTVLGAACLATVGRRCFRV